MGFWWAGFWAMVAPLVYKVVTALGVGFVTFKGVDVALSGLETYARSTVGQAPAAMLAILSRMQIDSFFSLILSAINFRLVMAGYKAFGEAMIRKQVWRAPQDPWGGNPGGPV